MKSISLKAALWIGGVGLLILLAPAVILLIQNAQLKKQNASLIENVTIGQKALTDSLLRAESKIASTQEDLTDFADQNQLDIEAIRDDLKTLDATLAAIAITEGGTTTIVKNYYKADDSTPSDIEVPKCKEDGRPIDVWGHTKSVEAIDLEDSNGMKVAKASFEAAKERPWSSKVYGIRYKVLNSIGRQQNGRLVLHTELTAENPEAQPGETFRIKSVSSQMLELPAPRASFDAWDPKLYLAVNLGLVVRPEIDFSASFALGFSIMSYGDWRFIGVTAGYDAYQNNLRASLIPVLYNLGSPMPFLSDLWIFLDVGWSPMEEVSIGFGIATTI